VAGTLIRWGRYVRWVLTGEEKYKTEIQRVRCKECGKTHGLLPDFLHPYRRYTVGIMQKVIWLYLLAGMGYGRIMDELPSEGPGQETVREWVRSFGYGAGYLLLDVMGRFVMKLYPESEVTGRAPQELERSSQAEELKRSYHFWSWGEILYAHHKEVAPEIVFSDEGFFPYLLQWLQRQQMTPRLLWSPKLETTPTVPP
jgi:hypothetical protein